MSKHRDKYMGAYRSVRPLVLRRDNNKCVKCASGLRLEVHHVNGYTDNDIKNLQTLCYRCHSVAPMGEDYWEWLDSGLDGMSQTIESVGSRIRESYSDKTDEEYNEIVEAVLKQLEKVN
jgi:hypothetical protein